MGFFKFICLVVVECSSILSGPMTHLFVYFQLSVPVLKVIFQFSKNSHENSLLSVVFELLSQKSDVEKMFYMLRLTSHVTVSHCMSKFAGTKQFH